MRLAFRAGDHWASIDAGDGLQLGLHPAGRDRPTPSSYSISVGLAVDEPIDSVIAILRDRGVDVRGPSADQGELKLAFFADPDGNPLYLAEGGT